MGITLVIIHILILFFIRKKIKKEVVKLRQSNANMSVEVLQLKGKIDYLRSALLEQK